MVADGRITPVLAAGGVPRVAAVCAVGELFDVSARGLRSGIDKRPLDGPLTVLRHGVWGDVQGDREHHGGLYKAVYAFARETRAAWVERRGDELGGADLGAGAAREDDGGLDADGAPHADLPRPLPRSTTGRELGDGSFGENLVTEGIDTDEAVIGTRWRVGSTLLQVTAPRNPCRTFAAWTGEADWTRRFRAGGRCGAYLSVRETGVIEAGDRIDVEDVPGHGVTVGDTFRGMDAGQARALLDWAEESRTVLYESLVRAALGVLEDAGEARAFPAALRSDGRGDAGGRP